MTKEQKDKNFIIRTLAEIQGVFQMLEIQTAPLTDSQKVTLSSFVERIEHALNLLTGQDQ